MTKGSGTRCFSNGAVGMSRAAWLRAAFLGVASCVTVSCAVVTSDDLTGSSGQGGTPPQGLYYALPTALVDLTLAVKEGTGDFKIAVGEPQYIADVNHRYLMHYREMPNYHDKIALEVDPETSFLKKVHSDTTDQTDEIVVEIAKAFSSIVGFESAPVGNGFTALATVTVDPTEDRHLHWAAKTLSQRASQFAKQKHNLSCGGGVTLSEEEKSVCELYGRYSRTGELVKLRTIAPASIEPATPADCTVGLCYRGQEPWVLVSTFDERPNAQILELPNKSVIVELDISRAFLVQKVQKIDFATNGQLQSVHITKGSELEELSSIPVEIITAIANTVPIRLTIRERQLDLAKREVALVDARRKLLAKESGPVQQAQQQAQQGAK